MSEQLALLPGYPSPPTSRLTLPALLCSTAVSLPAGVAVTRVGWLERPVPGTAAVIQTVPSLAFLAVMVPLLAAVGLHSIGFLPAEVLRHGALRSAPVLDGRAARQSPLQIWLAVATVIVAIRTFGAGVERSASTMTSARTSGRCATRGIGRCATT